MADRKITDLTALAAGSQATGDLLTIVDVSEAAAADKNKKITVENLLKGIPSNVGIGETTPAADLVVKQSGSTFTTAAQTVALFQRSSTTGHAAKIAIVGGNLASSDIHFGDTDDEDVGIIHYVHQDNSLRFTVNASERVRIDSSGRLLVGQTSTSAVSTLLLENNSLGTGRQGILLLARGEATPDNGDALGTFVFTAGNHSPAVEINARRDGGTWTAGSSHPTRLEFSTTANGASSPTERMRIDGSGNIGVGTSSPTDHNGFTKIIDVNGGGGAALYCRTAGSSTNVGIFGQSGSDVYVINKASGNIRFNVADAEKMRIDSSGRLLVNTSSSFDSSSTIQLAGSDSHLGLKYSGTSGNHETQIRWFDKRDQNNAVIANSLQNDASGTQAAHLVFKTANAGTLSERMRITDGGNLLIGQTNGSFGTQGHIFGAGGQAFHIIPNDTVLLLNRQGSDGEIVRIAQGDVTEGNITVSGSTVSYNGGHLARWSQLASGAARTEILRGSVLSNLDEMCEWGEEDNEQLNRMKVSDAEGDVNVSGVFQAWDDDDDTYTNDFYCAMTGDFVIRIAQGKTVARGDLLMSAGDGTAKPQDDDIVRSKTIAKVTSTTVSTTYSDGSYCVPCVLMAC